MHFSSQLAGRIFAMGALGKFLHPSRSRASRPTLVAGGVLLAWGVLCVTTLAAQPPVASPSATDEPQPAAEELNATAEPEATAGESDAAAEERNSTDREVEQEGSAEQEGDAAATAPTDHNHSAEQGLSFEQRVASERSADAGVAMVEGFEYSDEALQRVLQYNEARDRLAEAITQMRAIHLRYQNEIDNSLAAVERYREQRDQTRELLDQTYAAALELIRFAPDREAASFLVTMIQHRENHDIYNAATYDGAARILDAGVQYLFAYLAAARSGAVSGEFEATKRIYDSLEEKNLEDCDRMIKFSLDSIKEQYEQEQLRLQQDAKDDLPRVKFRTTRGSFTVELFLKQAPSTVSHFIGLVEQGFYDGLDFSQVIDHLLAMTGDPLGNGRGDAGEFLVDEHDREDARYALRGSLMMAKLPTGPEQFVPDSASSQFAILLLPLPHVTEHQTVFGRVIDGMDVVSSLRRIDPTKEANKNEVQLPPDRILSAEVIRRPESLPEPEYAAAPPTLQP